MRRTHSNKRLLLSVTGDPYGGIALQRGLKGTMLARSRTAKPLCSPCANATGSSCEAPQDSGFVVALSAEYNASDRVRRPVSDSSQPSMASRNSGMKA